ncbi:hypothetical protein [Sphingomonas solaris]|uniref:Uncharacterized protein n=1 Tax=Alterirhizorhabdus solaris TaxID=2529389 RepID=A0A558R8P4_9SPHN|nr:hypothetical protein [Sphingomonas solaris]TVV75747.1 hypothetical protein FOY91_06205 [Sphingomonas solaris]
MREPSPRSSRLAIGGGLVAVIAVGMAGFLLGRESAPPPAPAVAVAPGTPAPAPPPKPVEPAVRVLGRADLLALADAAADAFASGKAMPADVAAAAGRQFDLVLPFGCAGPNDPAATAMGWQYDPATETLRVSATPVSWGGASLNVRQGDEPATATGFWINRPWSSSENCPVPIGETVPAGTAPVTLPGQTLAIAMPGPDNALGREGRAFETVQRVRGFDGSKGFVLRITGRLDRSAPGSVVRCVQPAGIDQRPICAIAAAMDEVRIENPATGATLATWMIGRTGGRDERH